MTVLQPDLFISIETGKTILRGTSIRARTPRQFVTEQQLNFISMTGMTMQTTVSSAGLTQILISLAMAVSMKPMW